jgi:hypothetical protein
VRGSIPHTCSATSLYKEVSCGESRTCLREEQQMQVLELTRITKALNVRFKKYYSCVNWEVSQVSFSRSRVKCRLLFLLL